MIFDRQAEDLLSDELEVAERQLHKALRVVERHLRVNDLGKVFATELSVERPLDPKRHFAGHNWFHPEPDGRWAGRSSSSTIYLEKIPAGRYKISFTFVRFVDKSFMRKTRILFNGEPLALTVNGEPPRRWWNGLFGSPPRLRYPVVYEAELVIQERTGDLTDMLTFVFPYAKVASETDARLLTGRLASISLVQQPGDSSPA